MLRRLFLNLQILKISIGSLEIVLRKCTSVTMEFSYFTDVKSNLLSWYLTVLRGLSVGNLEIELVEFQNIFIWRNYLIQRQETKL